MAALMVSLFVAAMDSTVVGTALPTIARELGSFELYPWIVAGYLITGTTTVPLCGPVGRHPRQETGPARRPRHLRRRVGALRVEPVDAVADRIPNAAGHRSRMHPTAGVHDRRRHLSA